MRWPVETCFEHNKQEIGMGDYQVRSWTGWHHHMTLCILAQFFLVRAFRYAPVAVLAPFDYGALIFAAVIGFVVWNEVPGINLWIGAAFVIASGLFILHRETRARASSA